MSGHFRQREETSKHKKVLSGTFSSMIIGIVGAGQSSAFFLYMEVHKCKRLRVARADRPALENNSHW